MVSCMSSVRTSKTDYKSILMAILGIFFIIPHNDTPFTSQSWLSGTPCVCVYEGTYGDYVGMLGTLISQ